MFQVAVGTPPSMLRRCLASCWLFAWFLEPRNTPSQQSRTVSRSKDWWALRDYPPPSPALRRLCPLLWKVWVVFLVAGSALLLDHDVFTYVGFVVVVFLSTAAITDSGDSPAPYFLHLAVPFFVVKGLREGGGWTAMGFYWAFFFLPAADFFVGVDTFNYRDHDYAILRERLCETARRHQSAVTEAAEQLCSSASILSGILQQLPAPLHLRSGRDSAGAWESRLATSWSTRPIDWSNGLVATDEDPATARYGESFYSFLPRCVAGSFVSAWRLEVDRCRDRNLPFWHNEMLWYWAASAVLCSMLTATFGPKSTWLFLGQSFVGILLFESLERQRNQDGKAEPVGFEHSWDAPHRLTNMVLFKLQRHGDHHVNSTRRYQTLRAEPNRSPQLPMGYPGCILLALAPPLWSAVMDKRVLRLRKARGAATAERTDRRRVRGGASDRAAKRTVDGTRSTASFVLL
eukprot:jgi/Undpi1/13640/HiC_scaffold_9.g03294.m1